MCIRDRSCELIESIDPLLQPDIARVRAPDLGCYNPDPGVLPEPPSWGVTPEIGCYHPDPCVLPEPRCNTPSSGCGCPTVKHPTGARDARRALALWEPYYYQNMFYRGEQVGCTNPRVQSDAL
eukprot:7850075-Pyramimonas_sp.AAC.1